jgi:hypothetical protein
MDSGLLAALGPGMTWNVANRRFPNAHTMLEPNGALGVESLSISARIERYCA